MKASAYTKAVIRHVLREWRNEVPGLCREWLESSLDRKRAERAFAKQLKKDFYANYPLTGQAEFRLLDEFQMEGFYRVNWRLVARYLLNRFCPRRPNAIAWQQVMFSAN